MDGALLEVLASPRRQEILRLVWNEERSAGEIHAAMPDVTFGAVSLQLSRLAEAGAVRCRKDGQRRLYQADRRTLAPVAALLGRMWDDALWRLKLAVELERTRRGPRRRPATRRTRGDR